DPGAGGGLQRAEAGGPVPGVPGVRGPGAGPMQGPRVQPAPVTEVGAGGAVHQTAGPLLGHLSLHRRVKGQDGVMQHERTQTEVASEGPGAAAHGQRSVPGQPDPRGPARHHPVS
ncbi:hypothetical protein CRUP_004598, partial [Coryphaenoides rupestris]